MKTVKILVLGDDGVGKSSIICSLISKHFSDGGMPEVYTDISMPSTETEDGVQVIIMDSSQLMSMEEMTAKVQEADSIVLVYDVQRRETLEHLMTFWLPFLSRRTTAPVILAGNKTDERQDQDASEARQRQVAEIAPILERFKNAVWAFFECSAKGHVGIEEVFWMAQIVVTHPSGPIYDLDTNDLTVKCAKAFERIFRFYDVNHDGELDDAELCRFQEECFQARLSREDVVAFKKVLADETRDGVTPTGITLAGFLGIFRMFLHNHTPQAPWAVLRRFGYTDRLCVSPESYAAVSMVPEAGPSEIHELCADAVDFLRAVFHQHSTTTKTGLEELGADQQEKVFCVVPSDERGKCPWDPAAWDDHWTRIVIPQVTRSLISDTGGLGDSQASSHTQASSSHAGVPDVYPGFTVETWLDAWKLAAYLNPRLTQRHLWYLGFGDHGACGAIQVARAQPTRIERLWGLLRGDSTPRNRKLPHVVIIGDAEVGKSQLVRCACQRLGQAPLWSDKERGSPTTSVAAVPVTHSHPASPPLRSSNQPGAQRRARVLMTEVPASLQANIVDAEGHLRIDCDLAVLLFDPTEPKSLHTLLQLEGRLSSSTPRVIAMSKRDLLPETTENSKLRWGDTMQVVAKADAHCDQAGLPRPFRVHSTTVGGADDLIDFISHKVPLETGVAAFPPKIPSTSDRSTSKGRRLGWMYFGAAAMIAMGIAVAAFRLPWSGLPSFPKAAQ